MNKKILAKVLGVVMAVCLMEKAGAWPHLHAPSIVRRAASVAVHEAESAGGAALQAGLTGGNIKDAVRNQVTGDAKNAVGLGGDSGGDQSGGDSGGEGDSGEGDGDGDNSGNNFEPDTNTGGFGGSE